MPEHNFLTKSQDYAKQYAGIIRQGLATRRSWRIEEYMQRTQGKSRGAWAPQPQTDMHCLLGDLMHPERTRHLLQGPNSTTPYGKSSWKSAGNMNSKIMWSSEDFRSPMGKISPSLS